MAADPTTEARSEHPPADVEEAARRALEILRAMKGKPIPIRFPSDEVAEQFNILIKAIGPVATAYLSERIRREKMEEALNRYRYAITWVAADSWDHCGDCRARLEWALAMDPGERLTQDQIAAVGKTFLYPLESPQ